MDFDYCYSVIDFGKSMTAICRRQWTPKTSPPESNFVYTGWSGISKSSKENSLHNASLVGKRKMFAEFQIGRSTQRSTITPYRIVPGNIKRQDQNTTAFKEVAIICHPCVGEYAFGIITSTVTLQRDNEDEELCSVFVPTNHLYIGDIFLVDSKDIIRPNRSIQEGIEIIVSGGMTMPQIISAQERLPNRVIKFL